MLCWYAVVKRKSVKTKLSISPTLTYGNMLLVVSDRKNEIVYTSSRNLLPLQRSGLSTALTGPAQTTQKGWMDTIQILEQIITIKLTKAK